MNAAALPLLRFSWHLPRRAETVPLARHLLETMPTHLGVADECRRDLALAMTEACTNAVRHAHQTNDYQVTITIDGDDCVVAVVDRGIGLDHHRTDGADPPDRVRESVRGLEIIRACTEVLELCPGLPRGLSVRMRKALTW